MLLFRNKRFMHNFKALEKRFKSHIFGIWKPRYFFVFHFMLIHYFFPNECPGPSLSRHRLGHSIGKKIKYHKMKSKQKLLGFLYSKNMANFEAFCLIISSCINLSFLKSEYWVYRSWFFRMVWYFLGDYC